MKYAIIIDAGSSGSRAFIYDWPDPLGYLKEKTSSSALLPVRTKSSRIKKISPGISSFKGRTKDIWSEHLQPLIQVALNEIPRDQHAETPVFFLATAGLRLLPDSDQDDILFTVCSMLQSKTPFLVPECSTHVSMISGKTEGLYGWLGLNYLVHLNHSEEWDELDETYGFLDMGGASVQLAFALKNTEHMNDLHTLRIRTAAGAKLEWKVFVTTWLEFGANQAQSRYRRELISKINEEEIKRYSDLGVPVPILDPCLPKDASDVYYADGIEYYIEGAGMWSLCEGIVTGGLNRDLPCTDEPCLFNGVHVPDFDNINSKFVGVSEFWYTLHDILGSNGEYEYDTLFPKISEFCNLDWETLKDQTSGLTRNDGKSFKEEDLKKLCFKSAWVLSILSQGFQFPRSPINSTIADVFQQNFQSAIEINGTEISWTLGRAVLYATSQITPFADDKIESNAVGYSKLNGEFIKGGELLSANEISKYIIARKSSGGGYAALLNWILILSILVVGIVRLYTGSFSETWDVFCNIRVIRRIKKKLARAVHWVQSHFQQDTINNIGYGQVFPHAGISLTNFDFQNQDDFVYQEGISSLRTVSRSPGRVGSRMNLSS